MTKTTILRVLLLALLAAPAFAQNAADWNSCWCGGVTGGVNVTCYEGSGLAGGCSSQIDAWNVHANVMTRVAAGTGVTVGTPSNGINEVNAPISSANASSRYGLTFDSTDYGICLMEPEANFGTFDSCESIGSPNGQPTGRGCGGFTEADVLVNAGFPSGWTTSMTAYDGKAVMQTTVLHEVGHALGDHHVFNHFSTMNYMDDDAGWFVTRIDARNQRAHYAARANAVTDLAVYPFKYGADQYAETYTTFTPTSVAAGGTFSLSNIRVENVGNAASIANVSVTFKISTDTSITTADTTVGTLSWASFSTWWESSSAITLTVPAGTAGGTYYVGAIVSASGLTNSVTVNNSFLVRTRAPYSASGVPKTLTVSGGCTIPGTTSLSAPAAAATGVATSPSLSWVAVSGATSYDVYLSTSSSPAFLKNVTTTSTTVGPLAGSTLHYWRVVAKNACGSGTSSATRSFTTAAGGTTTQVLANPGFESGNTGTWVLSTTPTAHTVITTTTLPFAARTGSYKAILGGYNGTYYNNQNDTLYQQVTIPAAATAATLSFYVRITSQESTTETTAWDSLNVTVESTAGATLATLKSYSNLNYNTAYVSSGNLNLLAYKGQTVRIRFRATSDGSYGTSFGIDDLALNVTQ